MIELIGDRLSFSFPEVHPQARLAIQFQRTLRIPDDGSNYPLPPGLGAFPLQHVDDHAKNVPSSWLQRGGIMFPMYQSEALWLNFEPDYLHDHAARYPFAIKVATGKQCAVSGEAWQEGLYRKPQNYMVVPDQPWLDGYVVAKGIIRQFVAMPLGSGYTAEEQLTGKAEHGGLQIAVYPMQREAFERRFPKVERRMGSTRSRGSSEMLFGMVEPACLSSPDMGLAPGGSMEQQIYKDPYKRKEWNQETTSRCFVHLCNSLVWESITGSSPPHPAPTAKKYTQAGLPWFEYYGEGKAVGGSAKLAGMKSVAQLNCEKGDAVLPENASVTPENLVVYRQGLGKGQVREGAF